MILGSDVIARGRDLVVKTFPLFFSRSLNIERDPCNCCKDWETDNCKVEHGSLIFRSDFTEKRGKIVFVSEFI